MKNARVASAAVVFVLSCAPEQPEATQGCRTLADCPLDEVCDVPLGQCIPEPDNRFLGGFECVVEAQQGPSAGQLNASEVVGSVRDRRASLPATLCHLDGDTLELQFVSFIELVPRLLVSLDATQLASGEVALAEHFDAGRNAAIVTVSETFTVLGASGGGFVRATGPATVGGILSGYIDVTLVPTSQDAALFGAACPRGRGECGEKTSDVGGVAACFSDGPICSRLCDVDSDCQLGEGICLKSDPSGSGLCTRSCFDDADCQGPLRCTQGATQTGCL